MRRVSTHTRLLCNWEFGLLDDSPDAASLTVTGAVGLSTDQVKFGSKSALFTAGSLNGVMSGLIDQWSWVFEGWFYPIALTNTFHILFDSRVNNTDPGALLIWLNSSKQLRCNVIGSGTDAIATGVVLNTWNFLQVTANGSSVVCRVNGGNSYQAGTLGKMTSSVLKLGETREGGNYYVGYMDSVRFTAGITRPTDVPAAAFTVDTISVQDLDPQALLRPAMVGSSAVRRPYEPGVCDLEDGGQYRIVGTVKVKGSPNVPVHRRVVLINERSRRIVRETWSDPVTGAYAFEGIRGDVAYTTLAYDYTGNYRGVLADNLTAERMP